MHDKESTHRHYKRTQKRGGKIKQQKIAKKADKHDNPYIKILVSIAHIRVEDSIHKTQSPSDNKTQNPQMESTYSNQMRNSKLIAQITP